MQDAEQLNAIEGSMHDDKLTGYVPSEQWRADFQKQATRAVLDRLNRIARARLGAYAGGKQNVQDHEVDDVVIGALGDTWAGALAWDPDAKPLYAHLKDAIKYRVRNDAKHSRRRRKHDEFEEDERGELYEVAAGAIVPTVAARDDRDAELGSLADQVIDALRPLAIRDAEVTSLLDALAKRVIDRDDVLEETGMTITEHNNSWRRLGRLVRELPANLRDHALAALA